MKVTQLQTPPVDRASANRRSKSAADPNGNLRKVSIKRLSPAFKAASEEEDAVSESIKEIPEVSDDNPVAESGENIITLVDPVSTPSSESVAVSALTSPTLSPSPVIDTECENPKADFFNEIKSIEAYVAIEHLREARIQVLKSKDLGSSKKILDDLIGVIIEELYCGAREENERLNKVLSRKPYMVFLSLVMGISAILMVWILVSDVRGFHNTGPTPT